MYYYVSDVKAAIDKAREMSRKYVAKYGTEFPRSMDKFLKLCKEEVGKDIPTFELEEMDEDTKETIRGAFIMTYDYIVGDYGAVTKVPTGISVVDTVSSAISGASVGGGDLTGIYLQKGLNFCWKRFTLCKELYQVLLDEEKYRNMDLEELITEYLYHSEDIQPGVVYLPGSSESITEIAAMEFLFPYEERKNYLASPKGKTYNDQAIKFRIPLLHVEKFLSKPYMEFLGVF